MDRSSPALKKILTGNNRHVRQLYCQEKDEEIDPSTSTPLATVLTCCDAEFSPASVFSQPPGQLYVVRSLAHVVDKGVIAAVEYGVGQRHSPLLIILGHQGCAVLTQAMKGYPFDDTPHLQDTLQQTQLALESGHKGRSAVLETHVRNSARRLLEESALLRELVQSGETRILMGIYRTDTGMIRWLKPEPTGR